jgi:glutathione S-transferase
MAEIELFQFHGSHFNEKARWALDLKEVPHRRHALLPEPHMPRMRMLTRQSQTPALRIGDGMVTGY